MIIKILSLLAKILWVKELGVFNGVALIIVIYIHEYGHYFKAKNLGYNPQIPRFIPFIGAYVKTDEIKNLNHSFQVTFFGPLSGGIVGLLFFYLGLIFDNKFISQLALFSIVLNLFNLLPISIFDGGKIARILNLKYLYLIFTILAVILGIYFNAYLITIVAVIGLIIAYFSKNEQKTDFTVLDIKTRKKYLKYYFGLILLLSFHLLLITK